MENYCPHFHFCFEGILCQERRCLRVREVRKACGCFDRSRTVALKAAINWELFWKLEVQVCELAKTGPVLLITPNLSRQQARPSSWACEYTEEFRSNCIVSMCWEREPEEDKEGGKGSDRAQQQLLYPLGMLRRKFVCDHQCWGVADYMYQCYVIKRQNMSNYSVTVTVKIW